VRHDLIEAVFARGEDDLVLLLRRVEALKRFLDTDDGANLLTAYQRAANIVRIEERNDETTYDSGAVRVHFRQSEEGELYDRLVEIGRTSATRLGDEDTLAAVMSLSRLREPVDRFFDQVTVNTDEPAVRENRLRLLARVRETMSIVADFSQIEG
jgi:glycyl-tRNA synthetase beta chain